MTLQRLLVGSIFILSLALGTHTKGQDLTAIGDVNPVSITGGVSINQVVYDVHGIESRRKPYTYFASGNVNFSLYGWSVPLSFSVSNQQVSFQQPFNQYSLHPTYKWITLHAGYTSVFYSPYTVSGHLFLGGAVDLAPEGKWRFSSLYGRFLKAVMPDSADQNQIPSFHRIGYGFKTNYADKGTTVDLILFHAQDDINSITNVPDSSNVFPEENLVLSLGVGQTFLEHFIVKGEVAGSALTRDIRSEEEKFTNPLSKATFFYTPRLSSLFYHAWKTSLNYQQDIYTVGVAYERIDPGYRTLGAYYFNNDLENVTLNGTTVLLQGKLNVAGSAGTQRDNLDKSKVSTMRRMVGSLNIGFAPTRKVNFLASYSTFQTYTNIRSQFVNINQLTSYDNLDTLNFTQLSRGATLSGNYQFGRNENRKQNININLNYQGASDQQGNQPQNAGAQFYNFNSGYSLNIAPVNATLSLSYNATFNNGGEMNSKTLGPVAALSKSFFDKKLRTTFSSSYNEMYTEEQRTNAVLNLRLNGGLTIQKKHNLSLGATVINRTGRSESVSSYTELTGTVGYTYAFGI